MIGPYEHKTAYACCSFGTVFKFLIDRKSVVPYLLILKSNKLCSVNASKWNKQRAALVSLILAHLIVSR